MFWRKIITPWQDYFTLHSEEAKFMFWKQKRKKSNTLIGYLHRSLVYLYWNKTHWLFRIRFCLQLLKAIPSTLYRKCIPTVFQRFRIFKKHMIEHSDCRNVQYSQKQSANAWKLHLSSYDFSIQFAVNNPPKTWKLSESKL